MPQGPAAAQQAPMLLDEGNEIKLLMPQGARVRQRAGRLTSGVIDSITGTGRPIAQAFALNLFPNVVFTAVLDHEEETGTGRVWVGTLEGIPMSLVTLAVVEGALSGHVSFAGGLYDISADPDGIVVVSQIDSSMLPKEAQPLRHPSSGKTPVPESRIEAAPAAAATTIDVMTLYTTRAKNGAGGATKIKAAINSAIARTNTAYTNSGVSQQIRSVYVGEIKGYTEDGSVNDLVRLQSKIDGIMDKAHTLRKQKKADLVALITNPANVEYCGVGYLMEPEDTSASMAPWAFSVSLHHPSYACLSEFTYPHELGHNMGNHHDPYVLPKTEGGVHPYSFGHVDLTGYAADADAQLDPEYAVRTPFRTIMASVDKCADNGVDCDRVAYFSSSITKINDHTTGTKKEDNARSMNNTRTIMADMSGFLADSSGGDGPTAPSDLPSPSRQALQETCIPSGDGSAINQALIGVGSQAVLCQGAVFELTEPVVFTADSQQVFTEGSPTDDRRAILRIAHASMSFAIDMRMHSYAELSSVIVDGNRPQLGRYTGPGDYRGGTHGMIVAGVGPATGQIIRHIKAFESRVWTVLHVIGGPGSCTQALVEENEIGPSGIPAGSEAPGGTGGEWSDGISFGCNDSIVRNNTVTDATDVGIVIFGASGSVIEDNVVRARTRALLTGIGMADLFNFTNVRVRRNVIDAQGATIHVGMLMGRRVFDCIPEPMIRREPLLSGAIVTDNRLEGRHMQYGFAVDGVRDWTVAGNIDNARHSGTPVRGCNGRMPAAPAGFQMYSPRARGRFQAEFQEAYLHGAQRSVTPHRVWP